MEEESPEGLKGDPAKGMLSCSFFNTLLEMIMKTAETDTKHMINNKSTQILSYADDIDVVGKTISNIVSVLQSLKKEAMSRGLMVNAEDSVFKQIFA